MNKYAIVFSYRPFSNSESVTEYFVPYTQDALLSIIKNKRLRQRLEESKQHDKNLDKFIQKYHLEEKTYIRNIEDIPFGEGSPNWINEPDDISDLSMWDYLADAIAVSSAEIYRSEFLSYVNALANATLRSRADFFYLKVMISLLVYLDDDDSDDEVNNYPDDGYDNGNYFREQEQLRQFMTDIRIFIDQDGNYDFDTQKYMALHHYHGQIIQDRVNEICELVDELHKGTMGKTRHGRYIVIVEIENILQEIYQVSFPYISKRIETLSILRCLEAGNNIRIRHDIYMMETCSQHAEYIHEKETLIESMIDKVITTFVNNVELLAGSLPYEASSLTHLKHFFSASSTAGVKAPSWARSDYGDGNGCFALLSIRNGQKYFSFSSGREVNKKHKEQMKHLAENVMKNVFHEKGVSDVYSHKYTYNWGYLHEDSLAERYTQIINNGTPDPSKYISGHGTYKDDWRLNLLTSAEDIGTTYGCCERKMLGFSGFNHEMEIYSRWAPCWRCQPAIIKIPSCDFYAFADVKEYKKGRTIDMSLKKYTVTTCYGVSGQIVNS